MPTTQQFLIGFSLLLVAGITGFIMSNYGGMVIDIFYNNATPMGGDLLISKINHTYAYEKMNNVGNLNWWVNLYYFMCYLLPLLGVAWYWQSIVKYQSYDTLGSNGAFGSEGGRRMRRRRR